jgi:hypothetical protein
MFAQDIVLVNDPFTVVENNVLVVKVLYTTVLRVDP